MAAGVILGRADLCGGYGPDVAQAADAAPASKWVRGHNSRVRVIAGRLPGAGGSSQLYAGVELAVDPGWKTYWRNPGDDAGVPPFFDFAGSQNLGRADVLYPAPKRFKSLDGDTIGYKDQVLFPVRLTAKDAAKPLSLKLTIEYGICREICIPAAASFTLTIPPGAALNGDSAIAAALALVPRGADEKAPNDPVLVSATSELTGTRPRLIFDVRYPGGTAGADLFIEAPEAAYVPQPQPSDSGRDDANRLRFVVDLTKGADIKDLFGKRLRLTLASDAGQSEAVWVMK